MLFYHRTKCANFPLTVLAGRNSFQVKEEKFCTNFVESLCRLNQKFLVVFSRLHQRNVLRVRTTGLCMRLLVLTFNMAFSFARTETQITSDKMFYIFNLSKVCFYRQRFGLILPMKTSYFGKSKNNTTVACKGLWWSNCFSTCCSRSVAVFPNQPIISVICGIGVFYSQVL